MTIKRIKIFIASAGSLVEERQRLRLSIADENDSLTQKGIYLESVVWEKESIAFTTGRKQQDFNEALLESDIMICLVFDKLGPFTYEEIFEGYSSLLAGKNPKKLYVYFKNAEIKSGNISDDFIKVNAFKREIAALQQVYASYDNVDHLWNQVKRNLDRDIPELTQESPIEQLVGLLNKINPAIHQHFLAGTGYVSVMVSQSNLPALRRFGKDSTMSELLSIRSNGNVIAGGAGNRNGSQVYDLEEGYMEGFLLGKGPNYPSI
jgi:hypothetical protein